MPPFIGGEASLILAESDRNGRAFPHIKRRSRSIFTSITRSH
jgi:hypothetical protein